ncbi:MAG TPA: glycosyl hydrolase, partial [Acidimicrobiia bacterium]
RDEEGRVGRGGELPLMPPQMPSVFRRPRAALLLAALVAASLAATTPAQAFYDPDNSLGFQGTANFTAGKYPKERVPGRLAPVTGALFGVHGDEHDTATKEEQDIYQLEQQLGRTLDIDNHYVSDFSFYLKNGNKLTVQEQFDLVQNRIPLIGWGCGNSDDIVAGKLDAAIDAAAEAMKAYPRELFMRYCWEMDGRRQTEPKTPEKFIAAWRYIHQRFDAKQATNVIWVWCSNAMNFHRADSRFGANVPAAPLFYPGDDVVDWVSADGYNWGDATGRTNSDSYRYFVEVYNAFMAWARSTGGTFEIEGGKVIEAPNKHAVKPIMVGEYGTQETSKDPNGKADWFRIAHQTVKDLPTTPECPWCGLYSDIAAMVYFDVHGKSGNAAGGWAVDTSPQALAAYQEASADPWFNQIHTIGWGPYSAPAPAPAPTPPPGPTASAPGPDPVTTPPPASPERRSGYWMVGSDGSVYAFGAATHLGNVTGLPAGVEAVDLEPGPGAQGYWIVDHLGVVRAFGEARALGNADRARLAPGERVTSLSATPTGRGYWLFTSKGRALPFGDAAFLGDMAAVTLNGPVLDSVPTPTGQGYYMVAADGGIFTFGDAHFAGSMGGRKLNAPVQSLVPDPDGAGYWLVASDGGVFAFDAPFRGSMGATRLNQPMTGMVAFGNGYLMVAEDGGIFDFSDRPFDGSLGDKPPPRPIVSVAAFAH